MLRDRRRSTAAPAIAGWVLAALLASVVTGPVLFHAGIPAFFHDWTWSPFRERMIQSWQLLVSAWSADGLGHPNSVPTLDPLAWLKVGLAVVFPGDLSLKAYLWLSMFAACAGVYRLVRTSLALEPLWAGIASCAFAGSPFVFAKIASGQSSEWAAVAAFVWGVSLTIDAFERDSRSLAAVAGLLFAASTIQLQYTIFAELAVLIALLAYGRRVSAAVPCIVAAGAIVFAVPSLWFLAQRGPLSGADVSPPYRSWEVSQSASIGDTLAQLGYSARYPETFLRTLGPWSVVVVEWAVWAIAALALTGCIAARSRKALVLAALGVAGVVWVCGVRGPAAPVWEWLFANSALAAFLREFFHAAVLVAVAYAALAALGLRWIARRSAVAATALGFVLVACSGMATWSGGLGPSLPHVSAPPYAPELAARLPETDHRVMFLPPERPLFVRADRIGGIDAFDWAGAHQRSTFEYYPSGPLAFVASALARGDWAPALHVLPRAACDAVVWRPDVTSPLWPADGPPRSDAASGMPLAGGARLYEIRAADMVSGARAAAPMPPSLRDFSADASLVYLDDPGRDAAASLERGIDSPDPSSGWVGYRDSYWAFGDGLATPTLGIVTSRRAAAIGVPTRGDDLLLWAPRGALVNGMKVVAAQYERIRAAGSVATIQALGPTAVGEIGERPASAAVEPSGASGRATSPWSYGGSIDVKGPGLLVLRQRYDPGWTVSVEGMRVDGHYRADGMTNAWVIDGDGVASFRIVYAPQRTAFWLLGLSLFLAAAWVAIAVSYRAAATASAVVPNGK